MTLFELSIGEKLVLDSGVYRYHRTLTKKLPRLGSRLIREFIRIEDGQEAWFTRDFELIACENGWQIKD